MSDLGRVRKVVMTELDRGVGERGGVSGAFARVVRAVWKEGRKGVGGAVVERGGCGLVCLGCCEGGTGMCAGEREL